MRDAVALPLLLTRAFHAKADIPAVLREATAHHPRLAVHQADVLGPSPLLVSALERRLREAGLRPGDRRSTGIVLASAGSTDPEAIAVMDDIARRWRHTGWRAVRPAFASASLPRTEDAVRQLRAEGCARIAVAPYVVAPGFLPDRIARGAAGCRPPRGRPGRRPRAGLAPAAALRRGARPQPDVPVGLSGGQPLPVTLSPEALSTYHSAPNWSRFWPVVSPALLSPT